MADGRDIECWDNHADDCRAQGRVPFDIPTKPGDTSRTRPWLRRKIEGLEDVQTCLDVGCGPGYWVNLFTGFNYTGFDQSTKMLELAREVVPGKEFILGNARDLVGTFGDRKFDLIFTSAVLQHSRHYPDKEEIVKGMYQILRPGGYYLCTENTFRADNCPASIGNPDYTENYSFTPEGWERWIALYGFKLLEYSEPSEYLYIKVPL
jgi:ubiquinone/menaquinone biosynthesis C-methylase UbiE